MRIPEFAKAIVGALATALAMAAPLVSDGEVSLADALAILGALLGGFGVVFAVPNAPAE